MDLGYEANDLGSMHPSSQSLILYYTVKLDFKCVVHVILLEETIRLQPMLPNANFSGTKKIAKILATAYFLFNTKNVIWLYISRPLILPSYFFLGNSFWMEQRRIIKGTKK